MSVGVLMNRGDRTKPNKHGHIIKLFFHIVGARTLVIAMGQPVFRFPAKGHTSAEIRYFELVRALGDLHDTEGQRF